jgi:hypothetical protein
MTITKQPDLSATIRERVAKMSSVVSYPKRCSIWGDGGFRGNCDGRLFLGLVLRYGATRVADPMMGSGTTRDVVEWLNENLDTRIQFWGDDLKTGFNLHVRELPAQYDLVWLHPPYWNIIRYSDDPADLSTVDDYKHFADRLRTCLERCYRALLPGGRLANPRRRRSEAWPVHAHRSRRAQPRRPTGTARLRHHQAAACVPVRRQGLPFHAGPTHSA